MKILIVDVYGAIRSTGKITTLQYRYLKKLGHDVRVCYRGALEPIVDNPDYVPLSNYFQSGLGRFLARLTGLEGYTHPYATYKLIKYTKAFHPDIVQLNILHGYYINGNQYLEYLKNNNYKVCYTMMDEYAYMGKCPFSLDCNQFLTGCKGNCPQKKDYPQSHFFDRSKFLWERKRKAYSGFKNIVFTGTQWGVQRAKSSALLKGHRIEELDEPIDFESTFYPRNVDKLKEELGIPKGNKVIVTVTRLSAVRKGGIYFFKVAEQLKYRNEISFVYVGCDITPPFVLDNLITIPYVKSQDELAHYYSLGDLFICTSVAETVPDTCIDALGCGTPVAGFAEGGTPYVAPHEFGTFTPTYDVDALAKVIEEMPKKDKNKIKACRDYAVGRYSSEVVISKLESIYNSL